tara:strand:- start:98 stop:409 length:312 start_codon:yes stop_codon:yes gene_type:complete
MSETREAQDAQWEKMYGTEPHHVEEAWDFALKMEQERDEARKLAEDMHMYDPQQRELPWWEKTPELDKLTTAKLALHDISQYGGAMRGEWASEKAAETLEQIQ